MAQTQFRPEQIAPDVWLAPGAQIVGDVTIRAAASVWFNAVIRGEIERIEIGERSNVQDCAVLHADAGFPLRIGAGVTIGHGAVVHGCELGDDVLVGMRAVVMNGARIGAGSLIGVGAVVTEGVHIPEGSLVVGLPGKVSRALHERELARIRAAAEHYVENARAFRAASA